MKSLKKKKLEKSEDSNSKIKKSEERKRKVFQREVEKLKKEAVKYLNETEWMFEPRK